MNIGALLQFSSFEKDYQPVKKDYEEKLDEKREHLKELRKKTGERIGEKVTVLKSANNTTTVLAKHGWQKAKYGKFIHPDHDGHTIQITSKGIGHRTQGDWLDECHKHGLDSEQMLYVNGAENVDKHLSDFGKGRIDSKSDIYAGGPGSGRHPYGGGKKFVKQEIKLPSGAKYTVLKPVTRGRPAGIKMKPGGAQVGKKHELAGRFSKFAEVKPLGATNSKVAVFDAEKTPQWSSKAKEGEGSTVVVNRNFDTKKMTIKEYGRGEHGFINSGETRVAKFNNMGRGAAYLNKRFGITQKFKEK